MRMRILCFLTAAVLILLPWTAPAEKDECLHKHWELRNAKEADIGVPGYTGDKYCLDCHTVFQRGSNTPALEPPAGAALDGSQDQAGDSSGSGSSGQSGKPSKATKKPSAKPTVKPTKKPKKQEKTTTVPVAKTTPAPKKQSAPDERKKQPSGTGEAVKTGRVPFSKKYPFRRVRMNPVPGIQAEAAGVLVWPRPASPLQQILNQ